MRAAASVIFVVSTLCAFAQAQNVPLAPGDRIPLLFDLQNDPAGDGPLTAVYLIFSSGSYVSPAADSNVGPATIQPGQTVNFNYHAVIPHGAPDGIISTVIGVRDDNDDVEPPLESFDTTVYFPIGRPQFLVGAKLRAVWQGEAFGELKFREERRAYRQAGRLLGLASCLT
jgi:hypothetical protein